MKCDLCEEPIKSYDEYYTEHNLPIIKQRTLCKNCVMCKAQFTYQEARAYK